MAIYNFKNLEMHYQTAGQGEPALLFIHGLGGNGAIWKDQINHFKERHFIISPDLFGHGQSGKNIDREFAAKTDADAIYSLMRKEIQKPFIAIGHSFAGNVIAEMMKIGDPLMKGAVFIDCPYRHGGKKYLEAHPPEKTPQPEGFPIFIIEADGGIGAEISLSWVNHFKTARYYLFECADHYLFLTHSKKFNRLLEDFIDKLP